MVETLRFFFQLFDRELIALMLTLPRLYAFFIISQIFPASAIPRLARSAAILALAVPLVPANLGQADIFDRQIGSYVVLFAKEFAIGFALGYLVGWVFWVVQSAGALIDNQRGAAIAASIDPLQGHETSPLGNLFSQAFLTYVFAIGAVLPMIGLIYQSYAIWPVSRGLPVLTEATPVAVLALFDQALRLVVVLAGPIVVVMFLAEFALALVSRFAPQVQVFILAMPIKSGVACLMLIFYLSILIPFGAEQLTKATANAPRLYDLFRQGEALRGAAPQGAPSDGTTTGEGSR